MASRSNMADTVRSQLLASVCLGGLLFAPAALAQNIAPVGGAGAGIINPADLINAPMTDNGAGTSINAANNAGVVRPGEAVESPDITIRNDIPAGQFFDPTNVTGIGQIITDSGGGFIGTCTGSLINPRTVLFAAHCVNTRPATAYGTGGVLTGVGFETNTRANAPGQVDELVNWLLGLGAGPGRGITNTAQAFYNVSQVFYDPRSLMGGSCTTPTSCFLEADIATAVLDTPAAGIPTWALLFSPLDKPASISTSQGTGYHVNIFGYGNTGNGTTGSNAAGGFRRRAAENMLGALVSLNDRNLFLFGTTGTPSRPQPLYFIDFDDPTRTNPRDFNSFRDNALAREGTTGPGDSGGPLVLDRQFSKQVVIGVLSGGSTFFVGQPGGSYGTQAFYQPLFLYWDWIVANNPYRYVTAVAGNRNWEDASGWVTELDPNYNILVNGQLVNGLPSNPGAANAPGSTVQFGEQCFQLAGINECQNIATGAIRNNVPNGSGEGSIVNNAGIARVAADGETLTAVETAQNNGFLTTPRPAATIANGLPGATNFVPNNVDGVRATGVMGRYYDVTLRNTGAVTLNSTVTVDRFGIVGATSQLNIAAGASLTSLIDLRQATGTINNNGMLITRGDYLLLSGLLTGSGTVRTPFLTSVLGTIAPGTMGSIGTLNLNGNLVQSSGSSLMIDIGAGGASDRLVLTANGTSTGSANVGGGVNFAPVAGYRPTAGDRFTFLTATGGVTGSFAPTTAFSAILSPRLTYSANAVSMEIIAGLYRNVIAAGSPIQSAYAQLLDTNRGQAGLATLYSELDILSQTGVRSNLEALAPNHVPIQNDIGIASRDVMANFVRDRIGRVAGGEMGGTIATYGRPLQMASLAFSTVGGNDVRSDSGAGMAVQDGAVADDVSVFLAGGYVDGRGSGLPTATPGGRSDFDGYYVMGGAEKAFADGSFIGFALGYSDLDGAARNTLAGASGRLIQGSFYGAGSLSEAFSIDLQASAGQYRSTTARVVPVGTLTQTLASRDNALSFTAEVGASYQAGSDSFAVVPRVALRYANLGFTPTAETGGSAALRYDLGQFESLQARAGLTAKVKSGSIRPFVTVNYVHEFEDRPAAFGAGFNGGLPGIVTAAFALPATDNSWFEAGAGLTVGSDNFSASVAGETTLARSDIRTMAVRGTLLWRF